MSIENRPDRASWPFPYPAWPDPPWEMEGRVVTAWFNARPDALQRLAHHDFPPMQEGRQARLRFYDIESRRADGIIIPFREAVLAYRTIYRGVPGEISVRMWTDSIPYLLWGREVFGWPLELSEVNLEGQLWGEVLGPGTCRVDTLGLEVTDVIDELETATEPPLWITPRRRVPAGPEEPEHRDVLGVRPVTLNAGRRIQCVGSVDVEAFLGDTDDISIEIVDGAVIEVGSRVELLGVSDGVDVSD